MKKISILINGFYVFAQSLIMLIWLIGCSSNPVVDDPKDGSNTVSAVGEITMRQSGGIAGISRIITVREDNDAIILTSIDRNQPKEVIVSQSEIENLWQKLETNEIFDLSTNQKLLDRVADGFFYEVNVQKGKKQNQFSVYAPETLIENGEARYNAIVQAIETFAESKLNKNNPDENEGLIIEDMKIEDISIQFLESFPLQIHVLVRGMLRNGCITLNEITQKRDGNTVNIHITTKQPKDAVCIQMVKFVTETITLEGGFLPGKYKLIVNGIVKEFEIGGEIPDNGVLEGKVTIGPLCPVEPCNLTPEQIAKFYTSRKAIIYEQVSQKKVTETSLNGNGDYSLILKPGSYIIDISDSEGNALPLDMQRRPFMGNTAPKEAEVKAGEKVTVDFDIDTGIR